MFIGRLELTSTSTTVTGEYSGILKQKREKTWSVPVHSYKEKQAWYHIRTYDHKAQLHNKLNHVQYEFFQVLQLEFHQPRN